MLDICSFPALFVQCFGPWTGNFLTNPLEIVPGLRMTRSEDHQGCVLLICSLVMFDCSVPAPISVHLRYFHYLARWFSGLRESLEFVLVQGLMRAGSTFISFKINVFELLGNLSITFCFLVPLLDFLSQAAGSPAINVSIRTDFFKIKRLLSGQHFRSQSLQRLSFYPGLGISRQTPSKSCLVYAWLDRRTIRAVFN